MDRKLTQRGKDRRRQLMDFAARRFAENGYHPTSVAEIVHGMGVGKGVFYWYFSSKEELFAEILREAHSDLRRQQRRAVDGADDPVARIEGGIHATLRWLGDNRHLLSLFQFAASEERFGPALRRGQEFAVADVARHVTDAVAAGLVRDVDPFLLAHAIVGITNHLARVFVLNRNADPDEIAEQVIAFCRQGILANPAA